MDTKRKLYHLLAKMLQYSFCHPIHDVALAPEFMDHFYSTPRDPHFGHAGERLNGVLFGCGDIGSTGNDAYKSSSGREVTVCPETIYR